MKSASVASQHKLLGSISLPAQPMKMGEAGSQVEMGRILRFAGSQCRRSVGDGA